MREGRDFDLRVQHMMEAALELLDAGDYPADIGAHLDLAICRFRDYVECVQTPLRAKSDIDGGRLTL